MKILMVGNDISVHGGITSVIQQILNYKWNDNVNIDFIPTYKEGNKLYQILFFLKQRNKIRRYIKLNNPDIIHIHMSHTGSFFRANHIQKIALRNNIKIIIHLHGSEFEKFYNKSSNRIKEKIKIFFEHSNCNIVLGDNWNIFIKKIASSSNNIIFNNSIKIPIETVKQEEKRVEFLFLGVLIKRKGVQDLLEAINNINLTDRNVFEKYNVKFNIGGDGIYSEKLKQYVKDNNIAKYVRFLGWLDDKKKNEELQKNHIFVLPSYNEGLPIAILEALSYGMPIISTNVGSIEECVCNEVNGYIFEPGDVKYLSEIIKKIILDNDKRIIMGKESKNIAYKKFDEKLYMDKLKDLYKSIA